MSVEEKLNTDSEHGQESFATDLPFDQAVDRLTLYQEAYNDRYRLAINIFLLGVSEVIDEPAHYHAQRLAGVRVSVIEDLPQKAEDFE